MARKAFSIHSDYYKELRGLPSDKRGDILLALINWASDEEPCQLDSESSMLFRLMCAQIERMENREKRRDTQEYRDWRISVFRRDKFTCQCCGIHGGKLNAHHIKRYKDNPESRTSLENGVTLCETCHRVLHKREGF